ncbi:hypothetical protein VH567_15485 [Sphingomonas sp. 4RDLI-65]|uniref:hypothetical protein n=1 Tax=Sphingomonas sp. 4RDLI-65 TaxID=3111641 RepID=UPI003C28942F
MAKKPQFFNSFVLSRFLFKVSALYVGMLSVGSAFSDYSQFVSDLRDALKAERWTVFYIYGFWVAAFFALELVRRKVRYDLDVLRYERLSKSRRRR